MKTRALLVLALAAATPLAIVHCSSDDSSQTDSGPQNGKDSGGSDVTTQQDTGPGTDAGPDAPNACATGVTFDNTKVPGWPSNIPQP